MKQGDGLEDYNVKTILKGGLMPGFKALRISLEWSDSLKITRIHFKNKHHLTQPLLRYSSVIKGSAFLRNGFYTFEMDFLEKESLYKIYSTSLFHILKLRNSLAHMVGQINYTSHNIHKRGFQFKEQRLNIN